LKILIFVPGIMGTTLHLLGEEIWPPTLTEATLGYHRVDKLLADNVEYGRIIEKVGCFDVYGPLVRQFAELGFEEEGTDKRLVLFPYDWRLDLEDTAKHLAAKLDAVNNNEVQELHMVAHSMGGLITRLVLETSQFRGRGWFGKLKTFVALATPHQGAPLALARVLGLDSTLGISGRDFRKLSSDPRFPAGYQLLPAPDEAACWKADDPAVGFVDIYEAGEAARLGLDSNLLARARVVHDSLAKGEVPAQVRYFYFAGTGHETVTRVNVSELDGTYPADLMVITRTEDAGDGTVPLWSALPRAVQKQIVVDEHTKVFRGTPFKRVFYRLLGGNLGSPLEFREEEGERLRLSIPTPVIEGGSEFELVLVSSNPQPRIEGSLKLGRLSIGGERIGQASEIGRISYHGPPVSRLRVVVSPIEEPALYELEFAGQPENSGPVRFAVAVKSARTRSGG